MEGKYTNMETIKTKKVSKVYKYLTLHQSKVLIYLLRTLFERTES